MSDIQLYNDDCFNILPNIPDKSIDMICCDLPYGTSACKWDKMLPLDKLWEQYKRLIKDNGAIVLFAQQPFTSQLIMSNLEMYKYNWIWKKDGSTNFLSCNYQPLKITEDICVFSYGASSYSKKTTIKYNPQRRFGFSNYTTKKGDRPLSLSSVNRTVVPRIDNKVEDGSRFPVNIIEFKRDKEHIHPTQKPVALLEYIIKTYSNENDTILDNCMGSGTCGVACKKLNRNFIGIEKEKKYFDIAKQRIDETQPSLFNEQQ